MYVTFENRNNSNTIQIFTGTYHNYNVNYDTCIIAQVITEMHARALIGRKRRYAITPRTE